MIVAARYHFEHFLALARGAKATRLERLFELALKSFLVRRADALQDKRRPFRVNLRSLPF
jgi:hypothetical protein